MVKFKDLNVETKVGMQKRVGWEWKMLGGRLGAWPSTMACFRLTSNTFRESNYIYLPGAGGWTLQNIRNRLWCCTGEKNTIYNGGLKMIRKINPNIGWINSIADLGSDIAVASSNGLFLMTYMGRI